MINTEKSVKIYQVRKLCGSKRVCDNTELGQGEIPIKMNLQSQEFSEKRNNWKYEQIV